MKFDLSLENINISIQKEHVLEKNKFIIQDIKQYMFDTYSVEEIFLDQKFYDGDIAFLESVPIIIPMKYRIFCKLADSKNIEYSNNISYIVETEDGTYKLHENTWRKTSEGHVKLRVL